MNTSTNIQQHAADITRDPRWAAVVQRDKEADGHFYYSVVTTGVYCRPSCAARRAKPENVQFFLSTVDAERAGFRPCKRCKPTGLSTRQEQAEKVGQVCRLIERSEEPQTLEHLAKYAGLSGFHLHRLFKAITGVTPREYQAAQRSQRVRKTLVQSNSVTDAIYDAGFNANSRFYEKSNQLPKWWSEDNDPFRGRSVLARGNPGGEK
jgi:AraC family transcriptional regulator of adaptative response/methylated-DNA-[protein]-cysteine methyltransferase